MQSILEHSIAIYIVCFVTSIVLHLTIHNRCILMYIVFTRLQRRSTIVIRSTGIAVDIVEPRTEGLSIDDLAHWGTARPHSILLADVQMIVN